MRVLVVTPDAGGWGGVARSSRRLAGSLRAAGGDATLLGPDEALFPGETRREAGLVRFGAGRPLDLQAFCDRVSDEIERARPDLVVGYYGSSGAFVAVAAAALSGVPSVAALRGNDLDRDFFLEGKHALVAHAVSRASAVTTVSREMARKVSALFGVNARFVPNAVDKDVFFPDPEGAAALRGRLGLGAGPTLGVFGELKEKRGLEILPGLGPELGRWQLVVFGHVRPEVRPHVPPAARTFEPLRDDTSLRAAYSLCDVVLHPSKHDGMPNVVLEAMACERTVLASRAGGLADLLEDGVTGITRNAGDAAGFREALASLREGPRPELGARAREAAPTAEVELEAFRGAFSAALSARARADR